MFNKILNKIKPASQKEPQQKGSENQTEQSLKDGLKNFGEGLISATDIIAPSAIEVDFDWIRINNQYYRTLFVVNYPRFVSANWLSSLINFDHSLDISMNIYPTEGKEILSNLRRKIAEMEAEISSDVQRGKVVDPSTKAKLEDALSLQEELVKGVEKFFQFGLYITIGAESVKELNQITKELESNLGSLLIIPKHATLQMEKGFKTTLPLAEDMLKVTRNMDTTSLATTFPFVSSDLSDDKGVMYGLNEHNGSLVVFDRFTMENANSILFAKSGAGKSYLVKLEALRSLMFGTEILVLDPENEYKTLTDAVGGQFISFSFESKSKINPFDLEITSGEDSKNQLGRKIMALHSLFKLIMGELNAKEEALLDRALVQTYKMRGITLNSPPKSDTEMPLIEDLYKVLLGMEEEQAASLAARLEKFIKGSFAGLFNSQTNVELDKDFIVFGIRDLEEELRPIAMHIILDFIWNKIRKKLKKRLLIVDEAWYLMQYADTAQYLYGLAKRARKYYLGLTTITQDVQDFLRSDYGKAIVTNSSIQVLLKQHPAAIDQVAEVFYLSEGEKQLLLGADIGEGIFFAGQNHVAIRVIASPNEHKLITSSPQDILAMKKGEQPKTKPITPVHDKDKAESDSQIPTQQTQSQPPKRDSTGREQL